MTWGFGDSEMDRYLPYCDVVEECPQPEPTVSRRRPHGGRLKQCHDVPGIDVPRPFRQQCRVVRARHEPREFHRDDGRRPHARPRHQDAHRHPQGPGQQAEPAHLDRPARGHGHGDRARGIKMARR
jgi:hypothetical protein